MAKEASQAIFKAIRNKGWNLYCRELPGRKLGIVETFQRGPVGLLESGVLYVILPEVRNPTRKSGIDAFARKHRVSPPRIRVAHGFLYFGRCVAQFSGGDQEEYFVHPGDEIGFIGIEFRERDVRLLSPTATFMPYDVFLASLESLRDIRGLEENPA